MVDPRGTQIFVRYMDAEGAVSQITRVEKSVEPISSFGLITICDAGGRVNGARSFEPASVIYVTRAVTAVSLGFSIVMNVSNPQSDVPSARYHAGVLPTFIVNGTLEVVPPPGPGVNTWT